MSTEARARVLSLYKQILRTGRLWDGPTEEKQYILSEAQRQFRANSTTKHNTARDKQILEAEVRLQYALQYRIPYPRLEHTAQARGRPKPQQLFGVQPEAGRTPGGGKLAEAMQRRKQAQQDTPR